MSEEIEISELELKETLSGDDLIVMEDANNTFATTLTMFKNWLKSFFVTVDEDQTIFGKKNFYETPTIPTPANETNNKEAANIEFINNKLRVLSALPSPVDENSFYFLTSGRLYKGSTLIMDSHQTPDYANAYNLTKANGTAPADGWLYVEHSSGTYGFDLTINGLAFNFGGGMFVTEIFKVEKDDVYSCDHWDRMDKFKFIPNR